MGALEFLIGILLFALGAGAGAAGAKQEVHSMSGLTSTIRECKSFCGKGRTKSFDSDSGDCQCTDYNK